MPDFIIIGTQKGGTSSLYSYLSQHPCVRAAAVKEVHFFDENFDKGLNWYRRFFPTLAHKVADLNLKKKQRMLTGEASPYYIFHPLAAKRIAAIIPKVKLVAMLRNPVTRAYSHYQHEVRAGDEHLSSFAEAIAQEEERLKGEKEKILADEQYNSFNYRHYSYLARGIYADQLETWFSFFSPEQILIIASEEFYANPASIYQKTLNFLNLPDFELKSYGKYNTNQYEGMDATLHQKIGAYFQPHNERLANMLGRQFEWDKE
ncbi:MAG: sulfotransferase domain-containing protein [Oscillatoria sp. SIO1A7]|nr:sulfotransferase domain-containing protein [Oscillatoria sp. SIO1A7]